MKHSLRVLVFCSVLLFVTAALAQDKVVVIPLNSAKKLDNVVTVSAKGGDFTDPVAAVNSISDAAAANPYLVVIGPGVYTLTQTLVMKPYVSIAGSGQGVTRLTGAISADTSAAATIVAGAENATLRDLTVENTGGPGGTYAVALHNSEMSVQLVIRDVTAITSSGVLNISVFNSLSTLIMDNVTARASGGAGNIGVYNTASAAAMTNVSASAGGGIQNYGVWSINTPSPTLTNVTATASGSGAAESYGVNNTSSSPVIRNCKMEGSTTGINVSSGTVRVMQSSILNGFIVDPGGTLTCVTSDDGFTHALDVNCNIIP